ncbi:MAG: helix-turn-helix domain-containing protein, partial [Flavobacteriales bacterium]|nr:helix-turn-helix domain-containing protein [Flavobacteriales bacterium]
TLRTPIDPSVVSTDRDVQAFEQRRLTQAPLTEQLREQQANYLRGVLGSTFDLGDIVQRIGYLRKDHSEAMEFEDESMRSALDRISDRLGSERKNTLAFGAQLARLLAEGDHDSLQERLGKGVSYYDPLLKECMRELLQHLAQVEQLSRTKKYAAAVREIDGMLVKKRVMIGRAGHLVAAILSGDPATRFPAIERKVADQRAMMVGEVKEWLKEHLPKTSTKSGRKRSRASKEAVFAEPAKKASKPKGETYEKTYALVAEGKDAAEIAATRGLAQSTIEGHLARGIAEGRVHIDQVMDGATRDAIAGWMQDHADQGLNEANKHFAGTHSFGKLRAVQAWLAHGADANKEAE